MDRTLILMLALLTVPVLPSVGAQDAPQADWVGILTDPSADVRFVGPTPGEAVPERFATFDLVALRALERLDEVVFELQVRDLDAAGELAYVESADYLITFTHADMTYRILASRWTEAGSSGLWGNVQELDAGSGEWAYTGPVVLEQDEAADVIRATVSRDLLHDADGATPHPGRFLTDFHAVGRHIEVNPSELGSVAPVPSGFVDTMPDEGVGEVDLGFVYGVPQDGAVRLSSQKPFRISNGEATTMVYEVLVENAGDGADRFRFTAEGVPDGWSVRFPQPERTLAAGESVTVRALATMPFTHTHGESRSFVMKAQSASDGSSSGLELGVLFTEIPQPSGHHSRVWFHSVPWGTNLIGQATAAGPGPEHSLVFNAAEDYAWDSDEAVQSYMASSITTERRYWNAWLSPSLGMGLDFDLDGEGTLMLPIEATAPMQGLDLELTLWHWATDDRDSYDTAKVFESTTAAGDWGAGETRILEVPFTVRDEADRFDVRQFQGLTLNIALVGPGLGPNSAMDPHIAAGGYMDLPLFEYHDPVETLDDSLRTLVVSPQGATERFANPGATAVFPVRVENHGAAAEVTLSVTGVHADWTRVSPATLRLAEHGSKDVQVAVVVPEGMPDGELVDLVLEATAADGRTALQRIRVVVDTDQVHSDDAAAVAATDVVEAPGLSLAVLSAGLAVLAVAARRARSRRP